MGTYGCKYGTRGQYVYKNRCIDLFSINKIQWICSNPPKYRKNTITAYSMTEQNLVGSVTEKEENYDMLTVLVVCPGGPGDENYEGLLRMLDVLLSDQVLPGEKKKILKNEFDVAMTNLKLSEEECMEALNIPQEHRELYHKMLQDKMEVSNI